MRRITKISIAIHVVLAVLSLMLGQEAHADKDEASLHAHVQFGRARMGIPEAPRQTDSAPFAGVGARATYATSNWYAYEASVWLGGLTSPVQYTVDTAAGAQIWQLRMAWAGADLGVSARLGVRFIPTLHAALGMQTRLAWTGHAIKPMIGDKPPADMLNETSPTFEIVGTLGAGLDYRIGDHWIAGMSVTARRALAGESLFQAIAATFHLSYYFYPEGAGP
jgi:hypothetical protein